MEKIRHLRLDQLLPPSFDQRITDSPQEDDELMESIRELGVLLPLIVLDTVDGFEIVAGNRRFKQAGRAGVAAVPCLVCKTTGAAAEKIKLHENLHRLPLSHIDQGYTFAHLIKEYNMTETQVATLSKKSISYVSQHLSLIQSDDILVQAVHDGRLNFSVARELMLCKDDDDRHRLQDFAEKNGATQTVVRTWVHESNIETDKIGQEHKEAVKSPAMESPPLPMYPCRACEVPTELLKLQVVRMCPECFKLIFDEIDQEKFKARAKIAQEQS